MRFLHRMCSAVFMVGVLMGLAAAAQAATNFTVKNSNDSGTDSLRDAINQSNGTPGFNTISFNNNYVINLLTPLPAITVPVLINPPASKSIVINGNGGMTLLTVSAYGTQVYHLAFTNGNIGVKLAADSCLLHTCRVGTDFADGTGLGNVIGVQVTNGGNTLNGNVISGNNTGVDCQGYLTDFYGNWIGTNSTATAALPNTNVGIRITPGSLSNIINGGNIISGNSQAGVFIESGSSGNTICGNYIGTSNLWAPLGNFNYGVWCEGDHNWIGLPVSGGENYICFNKEGISFSAGNSNIVRNNYVGTNQSGAALGNSEYGIQCYTPDNLIGGLRGGASLDSNVIAANASAGIFLPGSNNTVCGNYIGCNAAGTLARSNNVGVDVVGSNNLIGGSNPSASSLYGNVISGNSKWGLHFSGGLGNVVAGNYVGLTDAGFLANGTGILIDGAQNTAIGGSTAGERNVISGNVDGLIIRSSNQTVVGNYFGTGANGASLVKNAGYALGLNNVVGCLIGGTGSAQRNVICGANGTTLVSLNSSSSGNTLVGNYIGVFANQQTPPESPYTNIEMVSGAHDNALGLKSTHQGNLIAGGAQGIYLSGASALNNGLYGNTICGFSLAGIVLNSGANKNQAPSVITGATNLTVNGTSTRAGDYIEVFLASRGAGLAGGSLRYLGSAVAGSPPTWSVDVSGQSVNLGDVVCALDSDGANNTSAFSTNFLAALPPTSTPTATITPSPTISVTATITLTPTPIPTATATPTITQTSVSLAGNLDVEIAAFPNPATKSVSFGFNTTQTGAITIRVYNTRFRLVKELKDTTSTGLGTVPWDVSDIAPGIYFYQITIGTHNFPKKKLVIVH